MDNSLLFCFVIKVARNYQNRTGSDRSIEQIKMVTFSAPPPDSKCVWHRYKYVHTHVQLEAARSNRSIEVTPPSTEYTGCDYISRFQASHLLDCTGSFLAERTTSFDRLCTVKGSYLKWPIGLLCVEWDVKAAHSLVPLIPFDPVGGTSACVFQCCWIDFRVPMFRLTRN